MTYNVFNQNMVFHSKFALVIQRWNEVDLSKSIFQEETTKNSKNWASYGLVKLREICEMTYNLLTFSRNLQTLSIFKTCMEIEFMSSRLLCKNNDLMVKSDDQDMISWSWLTNNWEIHQGLAIFWLHRQISKYFLFLTIELSCIRHT